MPKRPQTNLEWIKENVKIFLDQNIRRGVDRILREKSYRSINTVYSLGYVGANDGKLLRLIQRRRMILITHDKKFHKTALRYNENMSVLVREIPYGSYSAKTIATKVQNALIHSFKRIQEYYSKEDAK